MHLDALARQADEAKRALEMARTMLEWTARRWAERHEAHALLELQRMAERFDRAQRALEEALLDWARALRHVHASDISGDGVEAH